MVICGIPIKFLVTDKIKKKLGEFLKFTLNAVAD